MSKDAAFLEDMKRAMASLSDDPYQDYWKELGAFMHAFSNTENQLIALLRKITGVSHTVAGVIFSGTRSDQARDFINRVLDATGDTALKERLTRPFAQLAAISTVRNQVTHWGVIHDGGADLLVSNAFLFPTEERLKEFRINSENLRQMRGDLIRIGALLWFEAMQPLGPNPTLDAWLSLPWKYKPLQPSPHKKQPRPNSPKRSRQKPSSRASQPREKE